MKVALQTISHRLGRRMLLYFIVAALLPVLLIAGWSFYQVSQELEAQGREDARALAKSVGMDLFDHLKYATDELGLIQRHLSAMHSPAAGAAPLRRLEGLSLGERMSGLFLLDAEGRVETIFGQASTDGAALSQALRKQQVPGKPSLLSLHGGDGPQLYLVSATPLPGESGHLVVHLNRNGLWDRTELEGRPELICILGTGNRVEYCNRPPEQAWLEALATQPAGSFDWSGQDGEEYLSARWSLFLQPHFQISEWSVAVALPRQQALQTASRFQAVFPTVTLVALILVTLFSIHLIRGRLQPLEKLLGATRSLSRGRFDTRVELHSGDELQELGDAFNRMAGELGTAFEYLRVISEVEHRLQQSRTVQGCLSIVLEALPRITRARRYSVLCGTHEEELAYLWYYPPHVAGALPEPQLLDGQKLPSLPVKCWLGPAREAGEHFPALAPLELPDVGLLLVLPFTCDEHDLGLLLLNYTELTAPDVEHRQRLNQLVDVLSIALQNVFLDNRLQHQAYHDPLTGLPNRLMLHRRTAELLNKDPRHQHAAAVILLDVDHFKMVNDAQGHAAGDDLLIQVAQRLREALRPEDLVSRYAGDEFVAVIGNADAASLPQLVTDLVERLDEVLRRPFRLPQRELHITLSKGVALYPRDGGDFEQLMRNADAAMYASKHRRHGSLTFFSEDLRRHLAGRMETEQGLKRALRDGELELYYQPIVDTDSGKAVGAEALTRWNRPDHGVVMPSSFISLAEETGLIEELGQWALEQACRDAGRWLSEGRPLRYVSVNISGRQLQADDFVDNVRRAADAAGLPPGALMLEITETALIGHFEDSVEKLRRLRDLGIHVTVDDFGTGYASLRYLKVLPVDGIKIDRMFVSGIPEDDRDTAIVSSLVTLADELGLFLIAEGVETREQQRFLHLTGTHRVQGFLYSPPIPANTFEQRLGTVFGID